MKIATQPCKDEKAQEHYKDTVIKGVDLNSIKSYIEDEYVELKELYQDSKVFIWGVAPSFTKEGERTSSNETKWEKIEDQNTIVMFARDKKFFNYGLIVKKIQNKKLAEKLWGSYGDKSQKTWEYIYFLKDVRNMSLDVERFNLLVGYEKNNNIQGFNVLNENQSSSIFTYLNIYNENVQASNDYINEMIKKPSKSFNELTKKQAQETKTSRNTSPEKLKERLLKKEEKRKGKKVKTTESTQIVYDRDPDVIAYAHLRAKGICDLCGLKAPFEDKDGKPYLEVHHIKQLAKGGADWIDNVVALCPNCHRKIHTLKDKNDIKKLKAKASVEI